MYIFTIEFYTVFITVLCSVKYQIAICSPELPRPIEKIYVLTKNNKKKKKTVVTHVITYNGVFLHNYIAAIKLFLLGLQPQHEWESDDLPKTHLMPDD